LFLAQFSLLLAYHLSPLRREALEVTSRAEPFAAPHIHIESLLFNFVAPLVQITAFSTFFILFSV
jgi:hypothetical protein